MLQPRLWAVRYFRFVYGLQLNGPAFTICIAYFCRYGYILRKSCHNSSSYCLIASRGTILTIGTYYSWKVRVMVWARLGPHPRCFKCRNTEFSTILTHYTPNMIALCFRYDRPYPICFRNVTLKMCSRKVLKLIRFGNENDECIPLTISLTVTLALTLIISLPPNPKPLGKRVSVQFSTATPWGSSKIFGMTHWHLSPTDIQRVGGGKPHF